MSADKLEVVDGLSLPEEYRALLQPNELLTGDDGRAHRRPRFFYSLGSWPAAHEIRLAPHFKLAELIIVDCREADLLLRTFPHYVPCAIALLAGYLEAFRRAANASVFVSANGGYRSPAHRRNPGRKSMHAWGTAADIYRVGDSYLNDEKSIARYAEIAQSLGQAVQVRPYREGDDHLHLDLGFLTVTPNECSEA
ncbi:MAG: D-Ala-D-Ala carboxypeptidase family metallohydrolase [Chthoniobacterales bacterium]